MLAKRILGCRYTARLQDVEALVDTYVQDGDLSKEGSPFFMPTQTAEPVLDYRFCADEVEREK